MPRVVYAMAKDGLLYQEFAQISPFTNTPVKSTLIFGSFTAFIALIMSLEVLVEMMSIGTLMAYTLVCILSLFVFMCVCVCIYQLNSLDTYRKS